MGVKQTMKKPPLDVNSLKSEVASFASTLGLSASSAPAAGFDDSDFRKSGPIKPKPPKPSTAKPPRKPKPPKPSTEKPPRKPKPRPLPNQSLTNTWRKSQDHYKALPKLPLVKAGSLGLWHEDAKELEKKLVEGSFDVKMSVEEWKKLVEEKRKLGERLMWQYGEDYVASRGQSGDIKMLIATQRSGTAADKVSAYSVLLSDNPVANLRSVDSLIGLIASKVGKRHAIAGFEALRELFVGALLPDRKLKALIQRPVDKVPETKDGYSLLLFWYYEDCLKERYAKFVSTLEEASRDTLPVLKDKALKTIYILLKSKSEEERRLLSSLVNKLGDPQNRGASNADFHLTNLLSEHPNMKMVVIDEVDTFLFRPRLTVRAKYHAVNFLSQIRLSNKGEGPKVAKRLIDVYFALFKVLINEDGKKKEESKESHVELDSRILSALLTGVNRAFPYVSDAEIEDVIELQTPMLFRLAHSGNFNVGVQSLMLLDKIASRNSVVSDRFYRALYAKLLAPAALNSSKAELFTGLLLRAMKSDINLKRVAAFAKRLLQVALQQPPQFACGCLFVLSEVLKARPPLWNMVQQSEEGDDEEERFRDVEEDGVEEELTGTHEDEEKEREKNWYDPRGREPLYCKADRASWWELTVLASHVHPSVATMARTLLSGVNIVYNGNPLSDLSLAAFLDKFMEKKPKMSEWHGASEIEPAKSTEASIASQLIGAEILDLAEEDVPPEDLVFHTFYTSKMTAAKPRKVKKKKRVEESVEEIVGGDEEDAIGEDESDNEEIEDMLDAGDLSSEGEFNYEDLDRVEAEEDDDLIGDESDAEGEIGGELDEGEVSSEDEGEIEIGEHDDEDEGFGGKFLKKRKAGDSPFASLEEYEHLINVEDDTNTKKHKVSSKSKNKKSRKEN